MVDLVFLGTASGTPTTRRNVSGLALRWESGGCWIVDCGEGTQHRILRTDLRPGRIDAILITHLHGDHCYGLPGLLAAIAIHDRGRKPVDLVGPVGLADFVHTVLRVSSAGLPYELRIRELSGDGGDFRIDGRQVSARPLDHRVPCFGYAITEADRPGRLDAERAAALGISGRDLGVVARGEALTLADGSEVAAGSLLGPPKPGHKLVVLGDTCDSSALAQAAADCEVIVHEATYAEEKQKDAWRWKHSTAAMAGSYAKGIGARHLILTHFSARYDGEALPTLHEQAAVAAGDGTQVHLAEDLAVASLSRRDRADDPSVLEWRRP
jgi:ribonuclease Z